MFSSELNPFVMECGRSLDLYVLVLNSPRRGVSKAKGPTELARLRQFAFFVFPRQDQRQLTHSVSSHINLQGQP
jgi:hypothetical protein